MLAVLSLSMMIIGLDNTIVNVALPTLQRRFSRLGFRSAVDRRRLPAGLCRGPADHGHARRPVRAQTGLAGRPGPLRRRQRGRASSPAACDQLIALRVLMGLGAALIMPATLSIITNVFPREERGRAIGVWAGTAAIGIGLGPVTGGLLLEVFSWSRSSWSTSRSRSWLLLLGHQAGARQPRPDAGRVRPGRSGALGHGAPGLRLGGHRSPVPRLDEHGRDRRPRGRRAAGDRVHCLGTARRRRRC